MKASDEKHTVTTKSQLRDFVCKLLDLLETMLGNGRRLKSLNVDEDTSNFMLLSVEFVVVLNGSSDQSSRYFPLLN